MAVPTSVTANSLYRHKESDAILSTAISPAYRVAFFPQALRHPLHSNMNIIVIFI